MSIDSGVTETSAGVGIGAERPTAKAIRSALHRLCTKGVEPYWIKDRCPALLGLRGVETQLDSRPADRDEAAAALVRYLRELVARIDWEQHRIVLEIVLALDPEYLGQTAKQRRTAAGEQFRGGRDVVSWGTIRQYHEAKAIEKLYVLILADEDISVPQAPSE